MNSLDAAVAKEGAGIVRAPSWQAEADPAAGARCTCSSIASRIRRRCTPCFSCRGWLRRRSGTFAHYLGRRWRSLDPFSALSSA